ncbi:hypothetical protein ACROYT_G008790 [Oculina patagonica]
MALEQEGALYDLQRLQEKADRRNAAYESAKKENTELGELQAKGQSTRRKQTNTSKQMSLGNGAYKEGGARMPLSRKRLGCRLDNGPADRIDPDGSGTCCQLAAGRDSCLDNWDNDSAGV